MGVLSLNEVGIPDFVKVNKIHYSMLPPLVNNTMTIRGKKGLYHFSQDVGTRQVTVDITIKATMGTVIARARELAEWLYYEGPVSLSLPDEPEKYYMVVPDGETNIDEMVSIGQGTLTFLCTEAFAYGPEHITDYVVTTSDAFEVDVIGDVDTYPQIDLTIKSDITSISVIADDGFVMFGEPADVTKTPSNKMPRRLGDAMDNTSLWTSAVSVEGGLIQGGFSSDGVSFKQAGADYGTGTDWHGASAIRALPSPIQDFQIETWGTFKTTDNGQIGRIETYLLDENNESLGKIALKDGHKDGKWQSFEARAGSLSGGHYFINYFSKGGLVSVKNPKTKKITKVYGQGAWTSFYGKMIIRRQGQNWYAWIGAYDTVKKRFSARYENSWTDSKKIAMNKLAKVQVHIGAYGTYSPINDMRISAVNVYEFVELTAVQVPIIASAGNTLTVDCERSIILKDGEPFYEALNPASTFFSFQKGINGLAISPAKADVTVTYKERWL